MDLKNLPDGRQIIVLTIYDIVKEHGRVPIAIGIKVEAKEVDGTEFIILLPAT